MFEGSQELPRGTLELMILKVLSLDPMHGWGIIKRIQQLSQDVFQVNQGSLPRPLAVEEEGVDSLRVADDGEQPTGQVLRPHGGGPGEVGRGTDCLGAIHECHGADSRGCFLKGIRP